MPVIAATDPNCDMGTMAEEHGFGLYVPSNDVQAFTRSVDRMLASDRLAMGERGYRFLLQHYLVEHSLDAILSHLRL